MKTTDVQLSCIITKNILKKLTELDMTQKDLADGAGIHVQSVYNHTRGDHLPSVLNLYKICKTLGVTMDEICEDEE